MGLSYLSEAMGKLIVVTACFHYNDSPIFRLRDSCKAFGIDFVYYGLKEVFHNWRQAKLERLAQVLPGLTQDYDYTLFTDGFDSFVLRPEVEIIEEFEKLNASVVVSSELNCSPIASLAEQYPKTQSPFRFVCGGQFMGKTDDVINLVGGMVGKYKNYHRAEFQNGNDQIDWTYAYLEKYQNLVLDSDCKLFFSTCGVSDDKFEWQDNKLFLKPTQSFPCVVHFNGPKGGLETSQVYMDRLWREFKIKYKI